MRSVVDHDAPRKARLAERAAVVTYLRRLAEDPSAAEHDVVRAKHARLLADTIEHGHHVKDSR